MHMIVDDHTWDSLLSEVPDDPKEDSIQDLILAIHSSRSSLALSPAPLSHLFNVAHRRRKQTI